MNKGVCLKSDRYLSIHCNVIYRESEGKGCEGEGEVGIRENKRGRERLSKGMQREDIDVATKRVRE